MWRHVSNVSPRTNQKPPTVVTWLKWEQNIRSLHLDVTDRSFVQSPTKFCPPLSKRFLFTRWIHVINPKVLGNIPSSVPGYNQLRKLTHLFLMLTEGEASNCQFPNRRGTLRLIFFLPKKAQWCWSRRMCFIALFHLIDVCIPLTI